MLVVAPKRVAEDTWPREIAKWEHLKGLTYSLVMGSEKERRAALSRKAMIYIINRENVSWLVEHTTWRFDALVIDELSSFKSAKAQRFKALKKVRPLCSRVIGLTGTPAPNTLIDLWPQMYLLDMGQRLGRFVTHYRERFFVPDKRNREIVYSYKLREGAEQKIYELIGDICISMKATDHLKMPELTMNRVEVHLSAQEQKLYDTLKREMILQLKDGEIDAVNAAALSGKLLQMANGAVYDSQGRTVDFKNTILILTSNLGSQFLLDGIGEDGEISTEAREQVQALLRRTFRPEFLNRLDEIVFYKPLTRDNITAIIDLQIDALNRRLADKQITCRLTEAAKQYIIDAAYDPQFGARPLRRYVQHTVETLLARRLLEGSILPGQTLAVDVENGELVIRAEKA